MTTGLIRSEAGGDLRTLAAPILYLVAMATGISLVAASTGWLLAGQQPPTIARPAIE